MVDAMMLTIQLAAGRIKLANMAGGELWMLW
jgi:hypothetical protein